MSFNFYKQIKALLVIMLFVFLSNSLYSQGMSGTYTVDPLGSGASNFVTLKEAIDSLNSKGVGTGGVTFNIVAGFTETAPSGGYAVTATGTLSNPIFFQKNGSGTNPLLTAYTGGTATPTSAVADGVFRLIGSDYVTIDGIDLTENSANTTNPSTMEYGYGMFKASVTNGCQYITIKNCKITLSRLNNASSTAPMIEGSVGIAFMNSTAAANNVALTVTSREGTNSYNTVESNVIQNCNYGIAFIGFAATTPFTAADTLNTIGGATSDKGNTIINFGGATAATNPAAGIRTLAQYGLTVRNNVVNNNNGSGVNHVSTLRGIFINTATSASANISNNTVNLTSGSTTSLLSGIENASGSTATSNTITLNNNNVRLRYVTATTGEVYGIYNTASPANLIMNNNTSGKIFYGGTGLASSGAVYAIFNSGSATNVTANNNTVDSVVKLAGTTGGATYGIIITSGANQTIKNNSVTNLIDNATAGSSGLMYGIRGAGTTVVIDSNTVQFLSINRTTNSSAMYGISNGSSPNNENYNYNTVSNLTHNGTGILYGMFFNTTSGTRNTSFNTVHTLLGKSNTDGMRHTSSSPNIFRNKIYNISSTTATGLVSGLTITSVGTSGVATVYNNTIGDIKAPSVSSTSDGVRGINITATTSTSFFNLYYNTIYLNATSTGANFSSSGVFHTYSATATSAQLVMRNNIIINKSVPNGTGQTVAFRRSASTNLGNYNTSSNTNIFYAGTPGVANLIYADGTNADQQLSDFKTRVSPRENYSLTEDVNFVNAAANDLHVVGGVSTLVESGAQAIAGITTDKDGQVRPGPAGSTFGGGIIPDIGADEIDAIPLFPFGDIIAPTFTLDSISPGLNTCLTTAHSFYATANDASGIDSVIILWNINGRVQTPIVMTSLGSGKFVGVIPSNIDSTINYSFRVVDASTNKNSLSVAGGKYKDVTYTVSIAANATTVTAGTPINLEVKSPGVAELGTATTTNSTSSSVGNPYPLWYGGGRQQYLIRASELLALGLKAGNITSVAFDVATLGTPVTALIGYTMNIAHTTATTLSAFQTNTTFTQVFGPVNYTPVLGINTHTFSTPFNWDGTSNIIIEFCFNNNTSGTSALNYTVRQNDPGFTSSVYYQVDNVASGVCAATTVSGTSNLRPNMLISGSKGVPVSATWTQTTGGGLSSTNTVSTTATPLTAGIYTYSVTASNGTCSASNTIDITVLNPAAPIARFSLSNDTALTGGVRTTITLTDQSLNLPSAWKWSFVPNKVTYVSGTDSASQNPKVQFDTSGYYTIKLVASNITGSDSLVKVDSLLSIVQYCVSGASSAAGQDIGNVTINFGTDTLLNNGIATPATSNANATGTYSDFTSTIAPFNIHFGKTYNFSIAHISSATSSTSGRALYLDLNQDGDFTDPGEKIFTSASYLAAGVNSTGTFSIPRNTPLGITRMRVVLTNTYSDPSSCQTYTNGETEDYSVRIVAPVGDFYPPDFSAATITPPSGNCLPTSHIVTVNITDTTGVDSAWVVWSVANVTRPNIVMNKSGNTYSATIPAVGAGQTINYSFIARDISINRNIGNYSGGSIVDAVFNVDGTPSLDSMIIGSTVNFTTKVFPVPVIGNGTNTTTGVPNPYYTTYWGNREQFLIRASELTAAGYVAGNFTSLGLAVQGATTTLPLTDFTIRMKNTTIPELTTNFETGLTQVYTTTAYTVLPNQINTHNFQTPFVWDGVSNIIIETCFNNNNWNGSQTITFTPTTYASSLYYYADAAGVCTNATGTTSVNRPNFLIGQPSTVSLNWGVVPSATAGLTGANTPTPSATPTAIGTYKFFVTGNNGTCSYTDTVTVKVKAPTAPVARFGVDKTLAFANTLVKFSDSTLNLPDSVIWSFTPNTVTFVNGTTNKSKNPEVNFTAAGLYSIKLVAQNLGGKDSLTKTNFVEIIPQYCASGATSTGDEDIGRVRIGSFASNNPGPTPIANNTLSNKSYSDLLNVDGFKARIAVPDTIEVSIINSSASLYESLISAWIDMNKDGVFDASEQIMNQISTNNITDRTKKQGFTIAPGAVIGKTVMRVIAWETGITPGTGPCGPYGYGETEDYIINILPPPPGDYYPPVISNITLTPDSSCNTVSHTITASIFDTTAVDSAWIYYSVNGVNQTPIAMTKPTTGTIYSGVIGPQGNGVVRFRIFARDLSPININSVFSSVRTYQDKYFSVNAGADKYVGAGQTATLSANTTLDRSFRITEFNLFNYTGGCGLANGSQCTWPTNLPTTMYDDNLELTNLSSSPADLSGYTLLTEGTNSSITFPAGTIVPANGVVIVHLSTSGVESPANLIFKMTTGNFFPGSGSSFGIVLKNSQGIVIDAVALNSYSFTSVNGVTGLDWTGAGVVSPSGQAGATLQGPDLNNNSNWVTASLSTPVSIGFLNPSLPTLPSSSTITWTGGLLTAPVVGGTITTPVHPAIGTFDYIATSSNGVCTTSDTVRVNVVGAPVVNLGGPTGLICGNTPRLLDAGNPGSTYVWRFNNAQVATTRTLSATDAGVYKVTVTNPAGIVASDSITLTAAPSFNINLPDRTLCSGGTITLDAGSHNGYLWSNGATTQTIQVNSVGTYSVTVVNSSGCTATDTIVVTGTTPPAFSLGADQSICADAPYTINTGISGATYVWNTGATTQSINVSTAGTYSVVVTTNSGCVVMDTIIITTKPAPTKNLGPDIQSCPGTPVVLDAGNVGSTYIWNNGATTQTITVNNEGTYIVTVTSLNGCVTKDTVVVTFRTAPIVSLGADLNICTSDTTTLDAGNVGSTYLWSTGATTQTIRVSAAGTYSVVVTNTFGCSASDAVVITNKPAPDASFTAQAVDTARGQQVKFTSVLVAGNAYSWNFGDPTSPTNTSLNPAPIHVFTTPGIYTVTLTVTNVATGCISVETKTITVTTVGNNFAKIFNLHAAPNPFVGNTKIKYTLPEDARNVSIEVYDMLGRKITTIAKEENQMANSYEFDFNNTDVETNSGMYLVKLIVDGKQAITRVIDIAKR